MRVIDQLKHRVLFSCFFFLVSTSTHVVSVFAAEGTTKEAIGDLKIEEGFSVRVIASEPLISDPVSSRLDMHGRLWVIEMGDYPYRSSDNDLPNGNLKVLQDLDKDGIYDESILFAGGLDFPTGVQPYRNGAIVTLAGKIVFIDDQDGDLVGDEQEVWFDGFAQENQQLRANHPTLAPNGLVYVANGLRGGRIQAQSSRFQVSSDAIELRDGDFFFDPEGGAWGVVTGKSQYGLTIDDFGRRMGCSNRNPAMQAIFETDMLQKNPLLTPRDLVMDVAVSGEQSEVRARGLAWTTSNLHSGQFSAACGVFAPGWYVGGEEYLFVCEPTAYLVQRQNLRRAGSVWASNRVGTKYDFLTSTNELFRPVDLTVGAGQSILVTDMARSVIEHPDFMPPELKDRPDQRDGVLQGRIWQIVQGDDWPLPTQKITLQNASNWLCSASAWKRNCATQFFLEEGIKHVSVWEQLMEDPTIAPSGKARAAYLLSRFNRIRENHIQILIHANDERLRVLGYQIARAVGNFPKSLPEISRETSSAVLREQAITLILNDEIDSSIRVARLAAIAESKSIDTYGRQVISSVPRLDVAQMINKLADQNSPDIEILKILYERLAIDAPVDSLSLLAQFFHKAELSDSIEKIDSLHLLIAWNRGVRRGRQAAKKALEGISDQDKAVVLDQCLHISEQIADTSVAIHLRTDGLEFLVAMQLINPEVLQDLAMSDGVQALRTAALKQLQQVDNDWVKKYLRENWLTLPAHTRQEMIQVMLNRTEDSLWILSEVLEGRLPRNAIDPKSSLRLRQHNNPEVAALAVKLLKPAQDRQKVIAAYQAELIKRADPIHGRELFSLHCSACHQIDGIGTNVGPDISDTRTKSRDYLLNAILDPNAAIDASYVQTQILTVDGNRCDGLYVTEDSESVTIQQAGGENLVLLRTEIDQIKTSGISLMPEGFEATLKPQQMNDLVSFLKNWRYLKVNIPGVSER